MRGTAKVYAAGPRLPPVSPVVRSPPPAIIAVSIPIAPVVFTEVPVEVASVFLNLPAAVS
jgi:hypothetical protein